LNYRAAPARALIYINPRAVLVFMLLSSPRIDQRFAIFVRIAPSRRLGRD
jgi:hypothetical protein